MRREAILAIILAGGGASFAHAGQPGASSANVLAQAAFAPKPVTQPASGPASGIDSIGDLLDRNSYGLRPGDLPFSARSANDPRAEDLPVVHVWPKALSFDQGDVSFDLAPHAGVSRNGGSAEAGATLEVSKADAAANRLKAMGVKDGNAFGDKGRWYLFAAASGRSVGYNMLHGQTAGWSTDTTSKLVGDTQVGVGWRKGALQTSFGYVHRKVKGDHVMYGVDPHDDDMVALSLSLRPRK